VTAATPGQIGVLVTHARAVPAPERAAFAALVREVLAEDAFVMETCHRVEAYVVGTPPWLDRVETSLPPGGLELRGEAAVRHAIALAVGRDSVVVGEDQVLHQLRTAVASARARTGLDPILERLFATALRSGRRARSWRSGPERSLATVAVAEIERRDGPLVGRPVLVVGAGRMGRLAARAARVAGANVAIANRSVDHAIAVARDVDGEVVPFDPGERVRLATAVIVALGGAWSIASSTRTALDDTPVVVDLSVPAAVDADLAERLGGRLVTADDLARLEAGIPDPDAGQTRRLDALIDETTAEVVRWLDGRDRRAAASALAERAETARRAELDVLWRRLPDLDPESRAAIEAMTRHLSDRLLREPLERLGHDPDGRAERALRDVFAL
jgi:glutamyl-tRNA reductase